MAKRESKPAAVPPEKDASVILMLALMMQMLAFFILLTAMATITQTKKLAALNSLVGTFGVLSGGANLGSKGGPAVPARNIVSGGRTPPLRTAKELTETAKKLGLAHAIHVLPLADGRVRVRMDEHILFAPGQVTLSAQAQALMKPLSRVFSRPEIIQVRINGYTDETPTRGSRYLSNWEMSAARAMSVLRALQAQGVPSERLLAAGMGSNHPVYDHGHAQSRRVDIILKFHAVRSGRRQFRIMPGSSQKIIRHTTESQTTDF